MKVRLLLVVPPHLHPASYQQIGLIASRLPRDEFEVHLCHVDFPRQGSAMLTDAQVPVHPMPRRSVTDVGFWRRYFSMIGENDFDVVHVFGGTENPAILAATLVKRIPLLVGHDNDAGAWEPAYRWWIRRLARIGGSIVAHWPGHDEIPVDETIPLTYAPVDSGSETSQDGEPRLQALVDIPPGAKRIGAIGRFLYAEGLKDAIWTLDLLKVVRDDVHLILLGSGPQQWRLERFITQTETADRVHLLTDGRPEDVLPHLDVFWRTNLENVNPLCALTAMSHGIPVIANDSPLHSTFIVDGETGFLVPPGNRAMLARRTQALFQDDGLRKRMGNAAQDSVQKQFSPDRMISRLSEIYHKSAKTCLTKHELRVGSTSPP